MNRSNLNRYIILIIVIMILQLSWIIQLSYGAFDDHDIEYYKEHQQEILSKIKDKTLYALITSDVVTIDYNINVIKKAKGMELNHLQFKSTSTIKKVFAGEEYTRKSDSIDIRSTTIDESEKIFKVYVTNGTFGKYNKNKPIFLMGHCRITDSKGREFATNKRYTLLPGKSEMYIGATLVRGAYSDKIPVGTEFSVDVKEDLPYVYSSKHSIKIKNVKPILFSYYKYEDEVLYKKRLILIFNNFRKYVLEQAIYNDKVLSEKGATLEQYTKEGFRVSGGLSTAIDNRTGLMWACDANIAGKPMNWEEATEWVKTLSIGGYEDWRLPTGAEWARLDFYDGAFYNVQINKDYWSSDEDSYGNSNTRRLVDRNDSSLSSRNKAAKDPYAWPVRNAK